MPKAMSSAMPLPDPPEVEATMKIRGEAGTKGMPVTAAELVMPLGSHSAVSIALMRLQTSCD